MGGLYRLKRGEPVVPFETAWFGKPEGTTYADFTPLLDDLIGGFLVHATGAT